MYTRKDYLDGKATHREYFAQFVNESVRDRVLYHFSLAQLKESYAKDEHFNTNITPMKTWDLMGGWVWKRMRGEEIAVMRPRTSSDILPVDYTLLKETGEGNSSATMVCIYKEAARQILEQAEL